MDDFLRFFYFRTGVPCGYLLFFLAAAIGGLAALVLLVVGLLRKPRNPVLVGVGSLCLLVGTLWVAGHAAYNSALDMNPHVSAGSLAGTWKWKESTLILRADGSYVLTASGNEAKHLGTQVSQGSWRFTPVAHIELHDSRSQRVLALQAISFRNELHLVIDFVDPDSWDGDLSFSREPAT